MNSKTITMKKYFLYSGLLLSTLTLFNCSDDDDVVEGRFDRAELYVTSTASGDITVYDFSDDDQVETTTLTTLSTSNEGIEYDGDTDELFVASRSALNLSVFTDVEATIESGAVAAATGITATAAFNSPRALAINGDNVVVADNGTNQLFVYTRTSNGLQLRNTFDIAFDLWGVEFVGSDLYAVVDNTSDLAIFTNFLSNTTDGSLAATKQITIEGIVRTHGIAYDAQDDLLIMTDVGLASSDTDGAYHVIDNALSQIAGVANGGTLALSSQTRVAGSNTFLGNPIDVDYDTESNTIFIAEIANGGGRVLAFDVAQSGNANPAINNMLAGCSSLDFYGND